MQAAQRRFFNHMIGAGRFSQSLGFGTSPMSQMQMRMYHGDSRISMNSSQFVVLDNGIGQVPTIKINGDDVKFTNDTILTQIEKKIGGKVEFFAPDGVRIAKTSVVRDLLRFEHFKLMVNNRMEYHVQNKYPQKKSMTPHTPSEFEMFTSFTESEMKDKKARAATKIFTYLREAMNKQPEKVYSHEDIAMLLRDAIAE